MVGLVMSSGYVICILVWLGILVGKLVIDLVVCIVTGKPKYK